MDKKQEAEQAWRKQDSEVAYLILESGSGLQKSVLADLQCEARDSYILALRNGIEKEIDKDDNFPITGESIGYMKACEKILQLLDEVKPKE